MASESINRDADPMNSQRGKASTNASGQKRPKNQANVQPKAQKQRGSQQQQPRVNNNNNRNNYRGIKQDPQRMVAAAYSTGIHQGDPMITRGPNFVRIVHKELIANITGSQNFTIAGTYPLNPGMTTFLRWLPTQAVGWETYRWNKLEFHSFTRTGSNVPGSLAMIPDYDAEDGAPTDEFSASSYKDLVEDAPWKDICCKLPSSRLHPMGKELFLRYGPVTGTDIKTYDAGNLFITTIDGTAVSWSKLWAYYDVTLFTPQLPPGGVVALSNELHISGTTPTTGNSFPNQTIGSGSNTGIASVPITGNVITFNAAGRYLVVLYMTATTSVTFTSGTVSASGSLVTTYFTPNGESASASPATGLTYAGVMNVVAGTTLTFNIAYVLGLTFDLTITALSSIAA
jgi:hypothetical protein